MIQFSTSDRISKIQELDHKINYGQNELPFKNGFLDCNSLNVDLNVFLYRITKYDRLLSMIKEKKNVLVRPSLWEDPYENFLLSGEGILPNGQKVSLEELKNKHYAQCWSKKEECDGLWRNFRSKDDFAVKIKVKAFDLFNEFYDMTNGFHSLSYFIGQVNYISEDTVKSYFDENINILSNSGQYLPFIRALLIKRSQFEYEEEVRLIFNQPSKDDIANVKNPWDGTDLFSYVIDPNLLIDEIIFEPWIDDADFKAKEKELRTIGYTGKINKSSLYDKPIFQLKL